MGQMQVSLQLTKAINSLRNIAILKKITICWKVYLCFGYTYSALQHVWTVWETWRVSYERKKLLTICLSSSCVLCDQCCQCFWIVHSWFPLRSSLTFISSKKESSACCAAPNKYKTHVISHKERDVNECLKFEEFIKYILLSN